MIFDAQCEAMTISKIAKPINKTFTGLKCNVNARGIQNRPMTFLSPTPGFEPGTFRTRIFLTVRPAKTVKKTAEWSKAPCKTEHKWA